MTERAAHQPLLHHLSTIDIAAPGPDLQRRISSLASFLLGGCTLVAGHRRFSLLEVELYLKGAPHDDPFAHGQAIQFHPARWYFHKTGSGYREASRKGLDVTCGREGSFAGGVLLRAARDLATGELIEGPSLLVDAVLRELGHSKVRDLVASLPADLSALPAEGSRLYLDTAGAGSSGGSGGGASSQAPAKRRRLSQQQQPAAAAAAPTACARVGLSLKAGDARAAHKLRYLARPYRFVSEPRLLRKGRPQLVLGVLSSVSGDASLASVTQAQLQQAADRSGASLAAATAAHRAFLQGQALQPQQLELGASLSSDKLCKLLGCAYSQQQQA
jgi:hypothetical protein